VVGSGTEFEDRGEHELKGVPVTWRLCVVGGWDEPRRRPAPSRQSPRSQSRRALDRTDPDTVGGM